MDYGRALRTCRAIRGWSQELVAEKAHLSTSYVSLIESGKRVPAPVSVGKLASALNVPESLFSLLASDLSTLPLASGKTFDQLGQSLLSLLVEVGSERKA